jgi:hypothetical protein
MPCLYYSLKAAKSTKVAGPFDGPDLASHILRMGPRNSQDQYELTGATVPQSIRELLEALERIERAFPTNKPIRLEMGIRRLPSLATSLRGRWSPFTIGFPRNFAGRSIACFVKSMGVHTPPTILWTAGSMSPTVTQRRPSMGRNPMDPLVDLRDLLEEEVSMCNYPLKSTN